MLYTIFQKKFVGINNKNCIYFILKSIIPLTKLNKRIVAFDYNIRGRKKTQVLLLLMIIQW